MRRTRLAPLLVIPFIAACELAPTLPDATEARDAAALLTVMSDVLSGEGGRLFATNNAGELLEINLDAGLTGGTISIIGKTAPLDGWAPKWNGITRHPDGTLYASSRTNGDPRPDPLCGGDPCTHIYSINPWNGAPLADLGSTGFAKVSDIDLTPDGTILYGNASISAHPDVGYTAGVLISAAGGTAPATEHGPFLGPLDGAGAYEAVSGGMTVDADGEIWATESTFTIVGGYSSYARLHQVDPVTGNSISQKYITRPGGTTYYNFGFSAIEALPDANRTLIAAPSNNASSIIVYRIDRTTGEATPIPLTVVGPAPASAPNGLETAPPLVQFQSMTVLSAIAHLDDQGLPGGDSFELEASYVLGSASNGTDPLTEPVTITVGSLKVQLLPPAFTRVEAELRYRYENPAGPLTVMEIRDDGTFLVEADGLTLSDLLEPGVPVVLQIGDDVGGTTTDFDVSTPGGGIPQLDPGLLLGSTNKGELVLIDLASRTMNLIGSAPAQGSPSNLGWSDLAVTAQGELYGVTNQRSGSADDGCDGAIGTGGRCAHLYRIDPVTGAVVDYRGNVGAAFVSDIEFDRGGTLLGTFFANLVDAENGALAHIDTDTGVGTLVGAYGRFDGILLDNGGLSVHPQTGDIWAVESGFYSAPEFFRVNPSTGAHTGDVKPLIHNGGTPTFRISGMEILADGRMFLTKGGTTGLYLLDPVSGQMREIPLTIDPAIQGALNGIDSYRAAVSGDVRDTYIQEYDPHRNDGANPKLRATKKERTLLGFDLEGLDLASVTSATLVLSVAPGSDGDFDWDKSWKSKKSDKSKKSAKSTKSQKDSMSGMPTVSTQDKKSAKSTKSDKSKKSEKSKKKKYGRIGVWQLVGDFIEGNGSTGGLTFEEWVRGDGEGATWKCRADLNISNAVKDCAKADRWTGGKTQGKQTDLYMMTGSEVTVEFDITRDVQNGVSSWLVKAKDANGEATFWSREGAAAEGNSDLAPRLVITTN